MKNILILSSSPRKGGDTVLFCDVFAKCGIKGTKRLARVYNHGRKVM